MLAPRPQGLTWPQQCFQHPPSPITSLHLPKPRRVVARAETEWSTQQVAVQSRGDAARRAGLRLENLLSGVGDGEEELLNNVLEEQSAANKVLLSTSVGGIAITVSVGLCWLCGNDPLGGARLSADSLFAALLGIGAAVPPLLLRKMLWNIEMIEQSAVLQYLTLRQAEYLRPLIRGLSSSQRAMILVSDAISMVVILLPTLMGCIDSSLTLYCNILGDQLGVHVPDAFPFAIALIVSSAAFAFTRFGVTSATEDEVTVVADAITNADRYYRVMSVSEGNSGDPSLNASAFKAVAGNWLTKTHTAAMLAGVIGLFDVLYLGLIWKSTGDLTAPAVVAILCSALEYDSIVRWCNIPDEAS